MKKLFLVRHAKSDWDNSYLKDIDRTLSERGYNNANQMSQQLAEIPDVMISSPAVRAISTALIFARNTNYYPNNIIIREELYETSVREYLSVIQNIDNRFQSAMVFAHNPTISDFANSLIKALPMDMVTCAIVGISFDTDDWKKVKTGELFLFDYPKKNEDL